jgi:hypothetical protein
MKLLFCPGMAVLTYVPVFTADGVTPLVPGLDVGTGGGPVLELLGAAPFVLVIMKLWACITLTTQPWWLFARLCLVIGQDVGGVQPLGVVVQQAPLLVEAIGPNYRIRFAILNGLQFPRIKEQ